MCIRDSHNVVSVDRTTQLLNQANSLTNKPPSFSNLSAEFIHPSFINQPTVQRVIPSQGSINGGIEITLLGSKFKQDQVIKFGDNVALSTQCWSETTMVTYLPPSSFSGQVYVTVIDSNQNTNMNHMDIPQNYKGIFTYIDDTDSQLIELALQIVGLKMNGKLEDARNIAKRIVDSDTATPPMNNRASIPGSGSSQYADADDIPDEVILCKVIKMLDSRANISMCDDRGRTLLHLASLKRYFNLCSILIRSGIRVNDRDAFGFTALHFACISGDARIIRLLLSCKVDIGAIATNGVTARQLFMKNHVHTSHELTNSSLEYIEEVIDMLDASENNDNNEEIERKMSYVSVDSSVFASDQLNGEEFPVIDIQEDSDNFDDSDVEHEEDGDESLLNEEGPLEVATGNDLIEGTKWRELSPNIVEESISVSPIVEINDETSFWNKMLTRLDELPKYDDLFPKGTKDLKGKEDQETSSLISSTETSQSTFTEDSTSSEDEAEAFRRGFNTFFQKRQTFKNDKMLIFFWLPLMIILLAWFISYTLGGDGGFVYRMSTVVPVYLRDGLAKLVLGNQRMQAVLKTKITNLQTMKDKYVLNAR